MSRCVTFEDVTSPPLTWSSSFLILPAVARPPFSIQLQEAWHQRNSLLCCGLDPQLEALPPGIPKSPKGLLQFCQTLADAVSPHVCAFKPQAAHFAAAGAEAELAELIAYLHDQHPTLPVILDAKRGDIGATAERYAAEAFDRYQADAVTVNPFLGPSTVEPFLKWQNRGTILLCRTSNPDSEWLQGSGPNADAGFLRIARQASLWNERGNVALVVGATHPEELAAVRAAAPELTLLVPGVGAQGGEIDSVLAAGSRADGAGLVINVSRGISQASTEADYADAAAAAAQGFARQMRPRPALSDNERP